MAWPIIAAAAAAGAIAGGQKDKKQEVSGFSNVSSTQLRDFRELQQGAGQLETDTYQAQVEQFAQLLGLVNSGPGQAEVNANNVYQNQFASQLQTLLNQISNPSQSDISANFQKSKDLFAPDQVALNQ